MTQYQSFGEYLSAARSGRGLTIRELARRLDVQPSAISRIEDGTRGTLPHPDLLIGLVRELNLHWRTALEFVPPYARLWQEMTALALAEHGAHLSQHLTKE